MDEKDLRTLIMGIIANQTTDDSPWIASRTIRSTLLKFPNITSDFVDNELQTTLSSMTKSKLIVYKRGGVYGIASHVTLSELETPKNKKRKSETKHVPQPDKNLGKEVVITNSGRVSVRTGL